MIWKQQETQGLNPEAPRSSFFLFFFFFFFFFFTFILFWFLFFCFSKGSEFLGEVAVMLELIKPREEEDSSEVR